MAALAQKQHELEACGVDADRHRGGLVALHGEDADAGPAAPQQRHRDGAPGGERDIMT